MQQCSRGLFAQVPGLLFFALQWSGGNKSAYWARSPGSLLPGIIFSLPSLTYPMPSTPSCFIWQHVTHTQKGLRNYTPQRPQSVEPFTWLCWLFCVAIHPSFLFILSHSCTCTNFRIKMWNKWTVVNTFWMQCISKILCSVYLFLHVYISPPFLYLKI